MTTNKVRLATAKPVLINASLNTLRRIAAGEILTAVRTFPNGWHYRLGHLARADDTDAKGITPAHGQILIAEDLVRARAGFSPLDDFLVYNITPKGREIARVGLNAPDETQTDAFPETIVAKKSRRRSAVSEGH